MAAIVGVFQSKLFQGGKMALNPIQPRGVRRSPVKLDVVRQGIFQHFFLAMIFGVVQNQHEQTPAIGLQQLLQELGKLMSILLGMHHVMTLAAAVVQGPIHAQLLVGSGGWNHRPNPTQRPDLGQGRVEVNFTLIEVQQVEGGGALCCAFFKKPNSAFFSL